VKRTSELIATCLGCGYAPVAPGTAGSLAAVAMAIPLHQFARFTGWPFAALAAVGFVPAVWAATQTARAVKAKDPGIVVIDEVIGQWVALAGAQAFNWRSCLGAFLLFRLFDMWKPAPVRQLESLPEGFGIVADDVMAGIYAALVLLLAGRLHFY
jgi:phosphatidylglycerophosphatase A